MINIEEIKEQTATAERKAREAKAGYEFAKKYPQYNSQANFDILARVHDGVEITFKSLEDLIQHPQVKAMLTVKDLSRVISDQQKQREKEQRAEMKRQADALVAETKEREKLWGSIKSLLKVSSGMLEGEFKKYQLKDPRGNFIHPTSAMRDRLQALQETSVFRGTSTSQLKEHLRNSRPAPITETPPLPAQYTALKIRLMPAADLKRLMARYGSDVVTQRLQNAAKQEE